MGLKRARRIVALCLSILCAIFFALALFYPLPRVLEGAERPAYSCLWEDGTRTDESYYTAFRDYAGVSAEGDVLLSRSGRAGVIPAEEESRLCFSTLKSADLAELLALRAPADPLFSSAYADVFSHYVWYDGDLFVYDGTRIVRDDAAKGEIFVLLGGSVRASVLIRTGATAVELRPRAEVTPYMFIGTGIVHAEGFPPYSVEGNAVCLDTVSGKRLVAGLPLAKSVTATQMRFADEGALLACTEVAELDLAFAGSSVDPRGTTYRGELAHVFSAGTEYRVPESLKKVRIRGGALISHAFYACGMLEEIDACGVPAKQIEDDAFADCTHLKLLHCARDDLPLTGEKTPLPCGCTLYTLAS